MGGRPRTTEPTLVDYNIYTTQELLEELKKHYGHRHLKLKERNQILELLGDHGLTQTAIARRVGITRSRIKNIREAARNLCEEAIQVVDVYEISDSIAHDWSSMNDEEMLMWATRFLEDHERRTGKFNRDKIAALLYGLMGKRRR